MRRAAVLAGVALTLVTSACARTSTGGPTTAIATNSAPSSAAPRLEAAAAPAQTLTPAEQRRDRAVSPEDYDSAFELVRRFGIPTQGDGTVSPNDYCQTLYRLALEYGDRDYRSYSTGCLDGYQELGYEPNSYFPAGVAAPSAEPAQPSTTDAQERPAVEPSPQAADEPEVTGGFG